MKRPVFLLFAGLVCGEILMLLVFMRIPGSGGRLVYAAAFVVLIIFLFLLLKPAQKKLIPLGCIADVPGFQRTCRLILAGIFLGVILLSAASLRGRADQRTGGYGP